MLVLELKEGEAIQISDDIVIRFSDIHKTQNTNQISHRSASRSVCGSGRIIRRIRI